MQSTSPLITLSTVWLFGDSMILNGLDDWKCTLHRTVMCIAWPIRLGLSNGSIFPTIESVGVAAASTSAITREHRRSAGHESYRTEGRPWCPRYSLLCQLCHWHHGQAVCSCSWRWNCGPETAVRHCSHLQVRLPDTVILSSLCLHKTVISSSHFCGSAGCPKPHGLILTAKDNQNFIHSFIHSFIQALNFGRSV